MSVAFDAMSSRSAASSSLNGSELNALVARRAALRSQLATVEQQLAALPSTCASSTYSTGSPRVGGGIPPRHVAAGPLPPPITMYQTSARSAAPAAKSAVTRALESKRGGSGGGGGVEARLPAAMQPGNYAFWPKHLPGAASCRLRSKTIWSESEIIMRSRSVLGLW